MKGPPSWVVVVRVASYREPHDLPPDFLVRNIEAWNSCCSETRIALIPMSSQALDTRRVDQKPACNLAMASLTGRHKAS